jgi:hypothetical protein
MSITDNVAGVAIFALGALVGCGEPATAAETACYQGWHQCKDNASVLHSNMYGKIAVECKAAVENRVPFAGISWPWLPFQSYIPGDSYLQTGRAEVLERNLPIPNGFGAMRKSQVFCVYDLNAGKVVDVKIN